MLRLSLRRPLISIVLAALVLTPLASHAATTSTVEGTITAMSGTTLPAVLTVQSGTTSYSVNVTSDTTLVRKFFGGSTLDEFAVGDLVVARGALTDTTLEAKHIRNLTIQRRGGLFWGKVLSVDATAKTFVIDTKSGRRLADQTITTNASTKFFLGHRPGALTDIAVGQNVKIIGLWRKSQNTVVADRVYVRLTSIEGTITSTSCTTTPPTVTLTAKKDKTWTATLSSTTVIRDKQLNTATCADMVAGHKIVIHGLATSSTTINAIQIWDKGLKRSPKAWQGKVMSIDATAKTFVLDRNKGIDPTVVTGTGTLYVNKEGSAITFTDMVVDHKVYVLGTSSGSVLNANLIIDLSLPTS